MFGQASGHGMLSDEKPVLRFLPPKLLRYTPHVSVKLTLLDSGVLKGRTKAVDAAHRTGRDCNS